MLCICSVDSLILNFILFEKANYNLNVYNKTLLKAWHVFPKNQKDEKLIKEVHQPVREHHATSEIRHISASQIIPIYYCEKNIIPLEGKDKLNITEL